MGVRDVDENNLSHHLQEEWQCTHSWLEEGAGTGPQLGHCLTEHHRDVT